MSCTVEKNSSKMHIYLVPVNRKSSTSPQTTRMPDASSASLCTGRCSFRRSCEAWLSGMHVMYLTARRCSGCASPVAEMVWEKNGRVVVHNKLCRHVLEWGMGAYRGEVQ